MPESISRYVPEEYHIGTFGETLRGSDYPIARLDAEASENEVWDDRALSPEEYVMLRDEIQKGIVEDVNKIEHLDPEPLVREYTCPGGEDNDGEESDKDLIAEQIKQQEEENMKIQAANQDHYEDFDYESVNAFGGRNEDVAEEIDRKIKPKYRRWQISKKELGNNTGTERAPKYKTEIAKMRLK
jgi:hypothetical protein